jgi:hypothetical protein
VIFFYQTLLQRFLVCYCRSRIFEQCHTFKPSVYYIYVTILLCILVRDSNIYLDFSAFTSRPPPYYHQWKFLCYLPVDSHHEHKTAADVYLGFQTHEIFLDLLNSLFSFSSIWRMQKIWTVVDLLRRNPQWWSPIISSTSGLSLERRISNNILFELIAVIPHDNNYSQFYMHSCKLVK